MSPFPVVVVLRLVTGGLPGVVVVEPFAVLITTLFVTNRAESAAPLMFAVALLSTVKSSGSISQVPIAPWGAAVVILALFVTNTFAADVSIVPPLPPVGALASIVPLIFILLFRRPPRSAIVPFRLPMLCASMMPLLLTTL